MPHYPDEIEYSDKYNDDLYEYRHVLLPKNIYKSMPKGRLLSESEWRSLGVQQSRGWVHYEIHKPILQKIEVYKQKLEEQKALLAQNQGK